MHLTETHFEKQMTVIFTLRGHKNRTKIHNKTKNNEKSKVNDLRLNKLMSC